MERLLVMLFIIVTSIIRIKSYYVSGAYGNKGFAFFIPEIIPPIIPIVDLGTAGNFTIIGETTITDVPISTITGPITISPNTGAAITGLTCAEFTSPSLNSIIATAICPIQALLCCTVDNLQAANAVSDMQTAYTSCNALPPNFINYNSGNLGGQIISPGVYLFNGLSSNVIIPSNFALAGNTQAQWVFQITGTLTISINVVMTVPNFNDINNRIFWCVAGSTVAYGANSFLYGTFLGGPITALTLLLNTTLSGRLLSQTAVTLIGDIIHNP